MALVGRHTHESLEWTRETVQQHPAMSSSLDDLPVQGLGFLVTFGVTGAILLTLIVAPWHRRAYYWYLKLTR